jgi:hypothetical protein
MSLATRKTDCPIMPPTTITVAAHGPSPGISPSDSAPGYLCFHCAPLVAPLSRVQADYSNNSCDPAIKLLDVVRVKSILDSGSRSQSWNDCCETSQASASFATRKVHVTRKHSSAMASNTRIIPIRASRLARIAHAPKRTCPRILFTSLTTVEISRVSGRESISLKSKKTSRISGQSGSCSKIRK